MSEQKQQEKHVLQEADRDTLVELERAIAKLPESERVAFRLKAVACKTKMELFDFIVEEGKKGL